MGFYGRTIRSSDPFAGETEDESEILQQWAEHTLGTKRGTLVTAMGHGCDLHALLLGGLTEEAIVAIPAEAQAALESGRRVSSARVEMERTALGGGKVRVRLKCEITPMVGPKVSFTHDLGEAAEAMARGL